MVMISTVKLTNDKISLFKCLNFAEHEFRNHFVNRWIKTNNIQHIGVIRIGDREICGCHC